MEMRPLRICCGRRRRAEEMSQESVSDCFVILHRSAEATLLLLLLLYRAFMPRWGLQKLLLPIGVREQGRKEFWTSLRSNPPRHDQ